ncbi:hypothetical protein [Paludisphaera borealis]|uniref:Thioredoxin domain-containing protein n=1 Tax=Paludisphaera borealis TaxID=1387353 RepID=A0A1U7CXD6_9BACT|nr:hypothetical protein [Paludisphaera borealis]APW63612.1 hypothetical protein BSF38_05186 [Paludisphaera borealis]
MSTDPAIPSGDAPGKRYDRPSAVLGLITLALVIATAWLRLGPGLWPTPPTVGSLLPPTRLERLQDDEPLLLLGVEGRVTWLVFLSAESVEGRAVLPQLEAVWKKLRPSKRFAVVAAAVDQGVPEQLRTALAAYQGEGRLPLYLAGHEARRVFGVDGADPPWHFLVDPEGRIATIARGSGKETIDRLAKQAGRWLESLEPLEEAHFARVGAAPGVADEFQPGRGADRRNDVVASAARR